MLIISVSSILNYVNIRDKGNSTSSRKAFEYGSASACSHFKADCESLQ